MPMALPRGPNRRTHTAPKSTAMKPTSAILPNGDRNAASVTDPTAGKNSSSVVTTRLRWSILDRRRGLHRDDRPKHGDRQGLFTDTGETQQRDHCQDKRERRRHSTAQPQPARVRGDEISHSARERRRLHRLIVRYPARMDAPIVETMFSVVKPSVGR